MMSVHIALVLEGTYQTYMLEKIQKIAEKHAFGMVACISMTTIYAESHPPCVFNGLQVSNRKFTPRKQSEDNDNYASAALTIVIIM